MIQQGDIYWFDLGNPSGSEPGYLHPVVVVQNNIFNRSRINTAAVCVLTSNLRQGLVSGNVILYKGEANLPKKSIVNISQLYTVNKRDLTQKIGTLSKRRTLEIVAGIRLLIEPRDII